MNNDSRLENFLISWAASEKIDSESFFKLQRATSKLNGHDFLQKDELIRAYQKMVKSGMLKASYEIENCLQVKNVRSSSGIAVVSLLTKPAPCPGECIYCPTEAGVPKSYLSNEPAVMRAIANDYHPFRQITSRLKALRNTGHIIDKLSIRIVGGTWSSYTKAYRDWFIREIYRACNDFDILSSRGGTSVNSDCFEPIKTSPLAMTKKDKLDNLRGLQSLQKINETAKCRVVELSVETRQDCVDLEEILLLRKYGVTKVELGVQTIDDGIAKLNKRNITSQKTAEVTRLLKNYGFKISYQMMLNLYGSNQKQDVEIFKQTFENPLYKPDHMKIYPLALVENSNIYELFKKDKYKPYNRQELIDTLAAIKKFVPIYCRVERVIRDIPSDQIVEGGAQISNLRQIVAIHMEQLGDKCRCIRCREIKSGSVAGDVLLKNTEYEASSGREYFLSAETESGQLVGFCRLRCDNDEKTIKPLNGAAIIREIHVYGPTVAIGQNKLSAQQHKGWGKKLIALAEEIARQNGYNKMAVIAGVGVRQYFAKQGYELKESYMVKELQIDK